MPNQPDTELGRNALVTGQVALGIELGSTRVKAVLLSPDHQVLANGEHRWENQLVDGLWTYSLPDAWEAVRLAYSALRDQVAAAYRCDLNQVGAIGVSGMMHGYLAFDIDGNQLVPFRTWRNTNTSVAAAELSQALDFNIPLRWSLAHLYQAVLDGEEHVPRVAYLTTLAGYIHWQLTNRQVLGVNDASGMFPISPDGRDFDQGRLQILDQLLQARQFSRPVAEILPQVLVAGQNAGQLTAEGARLISPNGSLQPGSVMCPPEGDAGTGMVATNSITPRTGNISVGTSVFAMAVLEHDLSRSYPEVDILATPAGRPMAMIHSNNGASELDLWAGMLVEFAQALGFDGEPDQVFAAFLGAALDADAEASGIIAFNNAAGEPLVGLPDGRPLVVRPPDSPLSLGAFARAHLYGIFAPITLGMRILAEEGVQIDSVQAHGGLFQTPVVAQRVVAAALSATVNVSETAPEGGAWGIGVLAAYRLRGGDDRSLEDFLAGEVFRDATAVSMTPNATDAAGYARYLERYQRALAIQATAIEVT